LLTNRLLSPFFSSLSYLLELSFVPSFATANAEAYIKAQQQQGGGANTDTISNSSSGSNNAVHNLFKLASQDLEPSYFRSIDIEEKYCSPKLYVTTTATTPVASASHQ
jgi:hypothetical protein